MRWEVWRFPICPFLHIYRQGFPDGSVGKESACNAGHLGLIPGVGRSPGEGKGYPLQYSGLENSMACKVCGVAKSCMWLNNFHAQCHIYIASPVISSLTKCGTFVTIYTPTLTCYHHSSSCISVGFTLWCCTSMTLEKCIMTCIYHYNVINSSIVLKILSALPINLFFSFPTSWKSLIFLLSQFCLFQNVI